MPMITLIAEISELRSKGEEKRVIRISLDQHHVYTRTCVLGSLDRVMRHRDGFTAARNNGVVLENSMKREIRSFAESFGRDGSYFRPYAPRSRTRYVSFTMYRPDRPETPNEERRRHLEQRKANSDADTAATLGLLFGGALGVMVGIALAD